MTLSIKDPGSALTHFIGMILAGLAATPLLFWQPRTAADMRYLLWQSLPQA